MHIAELCRQELVTIDAGASVREAAALMREHHVGALVVTAPGAGAPHAVGVVTDRDLVVEAIARGLALPDLQIGQFASRSVIGMAGSETLHEAVETMERAGVRRLIVTGEGGEITGVVSADDLLFALAMDLGALSHALGRGLARERTERTGEAPARPRPIFPAHGLSGALPWPNLLPHVEPERGPAS